MVNAVANSIDVLSLVDPNAPALERRIDLQPDAIAAFVAGGRPF